MKRVPSWAVGLVLCVVGLSGCGAAPGAEQSSGDRPAAVNPPLTGTALPGAATGVEQRLPGTATAAEQKVPDGSAASGQVEPGGTAGAGQIAPGGTATGGAASGGAATGGGAVVKAPKVDKTGLRLAPEIQSAQWLNGAPVTMAGLRGKVVVIDFWTFG